MNNNSKSSVVFLNSPASRVLSFRPVPMTNCFHCRVRDGPFPVSLGPALRVPRKEKKVVIAFILISSLLYRYHALLIINHLVLDHKVIAAGLQIPAAVKEGKLFRRGQNSQAPIEVLFNGHILFGQLFNHGQNFVVWRNVQAPPSQSFDQLKRTHGLARNILDVHVDGRPHPS